MQKPCKSLSFGGLLAITFVLSLTCPRPAWSSPRFRVPYSFPGTAGTEPYSTLIYDSSGNLYGLVGQGGTVAIGAAFKLTPTENGSWAESLIYNFSYGPGATLSLDVAGDLYGAYTYFTGQCGAIYQLAPGSVSWTENTLFVFPDDMTQGCYPQSVIFDPRSGNLYGIAAGGGAYNRGEVFELTPTVGGGWMFNILYAFGAGSTDGIGPGGALTMDSSGSLYGTALSGGLYNDGTVFKLTNGSVGWTETTLYSFTGGNNGFSSGAGVILNKEGNLYGTTDGPGGGDDVGNIFELTPTKGYWITHVLHTFTGGPDGGNPAPALLAIDGAGNLYGSTISGGIYGYGTAFKLSPAGGGKWKETVLHTFTDGADGGLPYTGLVLNSAGNLVGTTVRGDINNAGNVFEIKP